LLFNRNKSSSNGVIYPITGPDGKQVQDFEIKTPNDIKKVVATRSGEPAYWETQKTIVKKEDGTTPDPIFVNKGQTHRGVKMSSEKKRLIPLEEGDKILEGVNCFQIKQVIKVDRNNVFVKVKREGEKYD